MLQMMESNKFREGVPNVIQRFRRPIEVKNKNYNDIYVTNKVPLCVYFRRLVDLMRFQIPNLFDLSSLNSSLKNNLNLKSGELYNKNVIYFDSKQSDGNVDPSTFSVVPNSLNKTPVPSDQLNSRCIRIFASGSCVIKAFYLLQDLYDHLYRLYLESLSRFSQLSKDNTSKDKDKETKDSNSKLLDSNSQNPSDSNDSDFRKKEFMELLKLLLDVDISTDSLKCVDDLWVYGNNKDSCKDKQLNDTNLEVLQSERFISTVVITIRLPKYD